MKTIEEKAEAYDEAIEGIQEILSSGEDSIKMSRLRLRLQGIFPELKNNEDEDERIRKGIISGMKALQEKGKYAYFGNIPMNDALAWLEKQKAYIKLSHSAYTSNRDVIEFADKYSHTVWEKLMDKFKKNENYSIGCNDVSDIVLTAIINTHNWLEKQKEQKHTDKVKPKFKIGDFLVNDYCMGKVIALTNDAYLLDTGQGIPFSCEHNVHLWTINDAKDGDILVEDSCIFIIQKLNYDHSAEIYCCLHNDGVFDVISGLVFDDTSTHPATKAQRDTLMKAMADAGYTFDFEKKELKEIEPKFKVGDWVINAITKEVEQVIELAGCEYICSGHLIVSFNNQHLLRLWTINDAKDGDVLYSTGCNENCIFIFDKLDNWKFAEPNGERAVATGYCCLTFSGGNMEFGIGGPDCIEVDTVKPATREQRDLLFQAINETRFEWNAEKKKLKLKELANQEEAKPSDQEISDWSEEDRSFYFWTICNLTNIKDRFGESYGQSGKCIDWLKSLKGRVLSQPKQEWSEEDEKMLKEIITDVKFEGYNNDLQANSYRKIDWLKSLKDRYTWKPSDLPHWKKNTLPNDNSTGFNSDYFIYKGYNINYIDLFEKLPKDD